LFLFKTLFAFILTSSIIPDDGWVSVPRPQRVPHQLEEDDQSIWVVFSKTFEEERVLLRFPVDPIYQRKNGNFILEAPWQGRGEFSMIVRKKSEVGTQGKSQDIVYKDEGLEGRWIRERYIESEKYLYVLRLSHSLDNPSLFNQFADTFEIEHNRDFHR
jgi:hypothetical protein